MSVKGRARPNNAQDAANGVPLSVRIAAGRPKSLKVRSKTAKAKVDLVDSTMFLLDPSGNALEFKAFKDPSKLFAK